ncbi:hypothetical protein C8R45DRAFT_938759 [Mycena sanguinolenta]|nr:hypothetical protein C8R45DRAFT_938759 [Mycena sanguinolenta]
MSGRQLFVEQNCDELKVAYQRMADTKIKSPAAVYQIVLKEQWDSLSPEEQGNWNDLAEKNATKITQFEFCSPSIHLVPSHNVALAPTQLGFSLAFNTAPKWTRLQAHLYKAPQDPKTSRHSEAFQSSQDSKLTLGNLHNFSSSFTFQDLGTCGSASGFWFQRWTHNSRLKMTGLQDSQGDLTAPRLGSILAASRIGSGKDEEEEAQLRVVGISTCMMS